jgi:hypothetical protein
VIVTAIGRLRGFGPVVVLLCAGCASPQGAGANGAQCYRIEDCQDGFVCVKSACTNQVKDIVGSPPMGAADAGAGVAVGGAPSDAAAGGKSGAGGTAASGGASGSGGKPSSGGAPGTGGTPSTGGAPNSGGTPSTGGAPSSGGTPSTGGTSSVPDGG